MIIRGKITEAKLKNLYQTIRKHIKDESCYYTANQIDILKANSKNKFIGSVKSEYCNNDR